MASINFGIKTGINEFFYLTEDKIKHWGIESEFLSPIVTSSKEVENLVIDSKTVKYKIFVCSKTKEELKKDGKSCALKYIQWGETQKTSDNVFWSNVPSVKGRKLWWDVSAGKVGDLMINRFVNERFYVPANPEKTYLGDVVFEGTFKDVNYKEIGSILANGTITSISAELEGRVNLGEGLLTTYGPEIERFLLPEPSIVNEELKEKLQNAFSKLSARPVKPIFEEVKMKDRQKLDRLIMDALGLDPENYLQPLYDGLTELVRERIDLGKMRGKVKKAKIATDTEQIKNQVIEAIIPNGVKKFPEDFLENPHKQSEYQTVSFPGETLKLGGLFMGQQDVVAENFIYTAANAETAKFIVYSQKPNLYIVSVPKDEQIVVNAIQKYETYLKDLKEKLQTELVNQIADYKLTDSVTQQIFVEYGLPQI